MINPPPMLAQISEVKREEIREGKSHAPLRELERRIADMPPARDFAGALHGAVEDKGAAIIAEFKRASPSKGVIRADADAARIAASYEEHGAACLSVLTDRQFFQAQAQDLQQARAACTLPVLRKEFIYDVWQVGEARAMGADAILLIMAAISLPQAREFADAATQWGMDVLIESHNEKELVQATSIPNALLGVNNRDLNNFTTSLEVSERLTQHIPNGRMAIAESGIHQHDDIVRLKQSNYRAFLVGERLMKAEHPGEALAQLIGGKA